VLHSLFGVQGIPRLIVLDQAAREDIATGGDAATNSERVDVAQA
jgi:hypothetical protein